MSLPATSASGHHSLQDTVLARPYYHDKIIQRGWPTDIIPSITTNDILGELTSCYQVVNFQNEPDVGEWRDLELNQELIPDYLSIDGFSLRICHAAYKALKFDNQDIRMICDRWDQLEDGFLDSMWNNLSAKWRCYVITRMILEADACNKGCSAGINGITNLGCPGSPRIIVGANIGIEIAKMQTILIERLRWYDGEMVLVIPPAIREKFYSSPYADALQMGACLDCSMLIDGQIPGMVIGFEVHVTTDVHQHAEVSVGGQPAYWIIAAHRAAYAFIGDIIESRIVEPTQSFSTQYQTAAIWGGAAIYPDAIVVGYWTPGD